MAACKVSSKLQRQLDAKGLKVKKKVIQYATFITADQGHAKAENHEVIKQKPEGVKREHGLRNTANLTLSRSCGIPSALE
jgi:hypothetical protein